MSLQKKEPISRNASQAETRKAGIKLQTGVKAGTGHYNPNAIGGRSAYVNPATQVPSG